MPDITIRLFEPNDAAAAAQLFFDAIHIGAKDDYDRAQRQAWAPSPPEIGSWRDRLLSQLTFCAVIEGELAGYMTLDDNGYIDLAFVDPTHTRKGVASALYVAVEDRALERGIQKLTTEASLVAKPFFIQNKWVITKKQTVKKHGVSLPNFLMEKSFDANI